MKQHKRIDIVGHVKLQVLLNLMAIPLFFRFLVFDGVINWD
ncbi:hypothetical protein [Lentilactobacillus hilgardii]|nr:hypothetical protein [Lentilactobacillus hilgardii]